MLLSSNFDVGSIARTGWQFNNTNAIIIAPETMIQQNYFPIYGIYSLIL
jgi:hypothetical protein